MIIGHDKVLEYLERVRTNNNVGHAYLFVGGQHIGKHSVAEQFAHDLLCRSKHGRTEKCATANNISSGLLADYINLAPSTDSHIGIDEIRELQTRINRKPAQAPYTVAVIDEADRMLEPAQNSLLKTLEEPPEHSVIILTARNTSRLLPTVLSRCHVIRFSPVRTSLIQNWLQQTGVDDGVANTLAHIAHGMPGSARLLAESPDLVNELLQNAEKLMKLDSDSFLDRLEQLTSLATDSTADSPRQASNDLIVGLARILRDVSLYKFSQFDRASFQNMKARAALTARSFEPLKLGRAIRTCLNSIGYLEKNVNSSLIITSNALHYGN